MQLSIQASLHHVHVGRGGIGPRLLALEADSPGELDVIEQRLAERGAFAGRSPH